jgi:hypothetical protein
VTLISRAHGWYQRDTATRIERAVPVGTANRGAWPACFIARQQVRRCASARLILEINITDRLPIAVADDETRIGLFDDPRRREAARFWHGWMIARLHPVSGASKPAVAPYARKVAKAIDRALREWHFSFLHRELF